MQAIFASKNPGKIREAAAILSAMGIDIVSMHEFGIDPDIVEDGDTFEANALIKAKAVFNMNGHAAIADDSGLEIDWLDKKPGVRSARFMGEGTAYTVKNNMILQLLDGVPMKKRTARFVCAAAAVLGDGRELVVRGEIEGYIALVSAGDNGFGYDPIFYVPEYGATMAQIPEEIKNRVSHRGIALKKLGAAIKESYRL
ncbi:MAG: RdgB/HAM1 family non-canonical purine NTP pyrophosphatase [Defluviitaleaceae bacterium]|nr:RdgB/HAM1 family non-canonical purine NTP pyrophosphatase [Defluviitaleaceae bacterium]